MKVDFNQKLVQKIGYLISAVASLEAMVHTPVDETRAQIDSCIQRFEYSFELTWKTLKVVLESQGQPVAFPRQVLEKSYQGNLIDNEEIWLNMLSDRNATSHAYNKEIADSIYQNIKNVYLAELQKTVAMLKNNFSTNV